MRSPMLNRCRGLGLGDSCGTTGALVDLSPVLAVEGGEVLLPRSFPTDSMHRAVLRGAASCA